MSEPTTLSGALLVVVGVVFFARRLHELDWVAPRHGWAAWGELAVAIAVGAGQEWINAWVAAAPAVLVAGVAAAALLVGLAGGGLVAGIAAVTAFAHPGAGYLTWVATPLVVGYAVRVLWRTARGPIARSIATATDRDLVGRRWAVGALLLAGVPPVGLLLVPMPGAAWWEHLLRVVGVVALVGWLLAVDAHRGSLLRARTRDLRIAEVGGLLALAAVAAGPFGAVIAEQWARVPLASALVFAAVAWLAVPAGAVVAALVLCAGVFHPVPAAVLPTAALAVVAAVSAVRMTRSVHDGRWFAIAAALPELDEDRRELVLRQWVADSAAARTLWLPNALGALAIQALQVWNPPGAGPDTTDHAADSATLLGLADRAVELAGAAAAESPPDSPRRAAHALAVEDIRLHRAAVARRGNDAATGFELATAAVAGYSKPRREDRLLRAVDLAVDCARSTRRYREAGELLRSVELEDPRRRRYLTTLAALVAHEAGDDARARDLLARARTLPRYRLLGREDDQRSPIPLCHTLAALETRVQRALAGVRSEPGHRPDPPSLRPGSK
ncbi:hypothetical protein [Actinokineospora sp. NBRC 105648]|uniref:hypothetical protein n=1 Tax=Actinokineospora sp. NBRC 105648 TaxID=3032206 RepID=UPI0025559109|nr:hypothetical protein [Actinokineospora sp. NBRC 105648]